MGIAKDQHKIVDRMLLEFKGDIEYFTSDIMAADGSSQSSNEASMVKTLSTWFCQYPGSVVQGYIPYSAYLDETRNCPVSQYKGIQQLTELKKYTNHRNVTDVCQSIPPRG